MLELSGLFKIVKKNKNTHAKCTEGVEVGDIIRVTVDVSTEYKTPIHVSKYSGKGGLKSRESFDYVGKAQPGTFYNNYSEDNTDATFTIEPHEI
jgi:hypothetical protein